MFSYFELEALAKAGFPRPTKFEYGQVWLSKQGYRFTVGEVNAHGAAQNFNSFWWMTFDEIDMDWQYCPTLEEVLMSIKDYWSIRPNLSGSGVLMSTVGKNAVQAESLTLAGVISELYIKSKAHERKKP